MNPSGPVAVVAGAGRATLVLSVSAVAGATRAAPSVMRVPSRARVVLVRMRLPEGEWWELAMDAIVKWDVRLSERRGTAVRVYEVSRMW